MILLIGAVVLGFVVARLDLLPHFMQKRMGQVGTLALVLLLFSMGVAIGSNSEIIASLPNLGGKALVLSISTITGSVLLVWVAVRATSNRSNKSWGGAKQ